MRWLVSAGAVGATAALGACASARAAGQPEPVPAAPAVRISGFQFRPAEYTVTTGDTVVWFNDDGFRHTATADSGAWSTPELERGQRASWVPRTPGRYPYHCAAHPTMRAVLTVLAVRPQT